MSNPLTYLPLALAGADGTLNEVPVRRLVAAGVALLQRTAPLVRTLHGHRSAILLPASPQFLVALAASEGRSAVLLDEGAPATAIAQALHAHDAAAVFTLASLAHLLPAGFPRVLLDEAPERATWQRGDETRTIDVTMHGGLRVEGQPDEPGADEEVLVVGPDDPLREAFGQRMTHRQLLAAATATGARERLGARDHTLTLVPLRELFGLIAGGVAPLLAGGRVTVRDACSSTEALDLLESDAVSTLVARPETFAVLLEALAARGRPLDAPVLQRCLACGALDPEVQRRWYHETAVPLRAGDRVASDGGLAADVEG